MKDLYMGNPIDASFEADLKALTPVLRAVYEQGHTRGFFEGHTAGEMTGFVSAINSLKPALSDGLRRGSSECGRAMQALTRLGAFKKK